MCTDVKVVIAQVPTTVSKMWDTIRKQGRGRASWVQWARTTCIKTSILQWDWTTYSKSYSKVWNTCITMRLDHLVVNMIKRDYEIIRKRMRNNITLNSYDFCLPTLTLKLETTSFVTYLQLLTRRSKTPIQSNCQNYLHSWKCPQWVQIACLRRNPMTAMRNGRRNCRPWTTIGHSTSYHQSPTTSLTY